MGNITYHTVMESIKKRSKVKMVRKVVITNSKSSSSVACRRHKQRTEK